jgi:hypothetical protein
MVINPLVCGASLENDMHPLICMFLHQRYEWAHEREHEPMSKKGYFWNILITWIEYLLGVLL